jgi:putative glutamine amidotransferase
MKPIIGVTSSYTDERTLQTSYDNIKSVTQAGGIPVVLPNLTDPEEINELAGSLDGVLVTGGGDIDPTLFGEEPHPELGLIHPDRDTFETDLLKRCLDSNKPVLAVCRGCQILNIAAGGDMYQDIYSQTDRELLQHTQRAPRSHASHFVEVEQDSLLYKITKLSKFKVNSFHHQALRDMADGFRVTAVSGDRVIEAFESTAHSFVIGVQWHPECMTEKGDLPSVQLFSAFVKASKQSEK